MLTEHRYDLDTCKYVNSASNLQHLKKTKQTIFTVQECKHNYMWLCIDNLNDNLKYITQQILPREEKYTSVRSLVLQKEFQYLGD